MAIVELERRDHIALVTLNRPEARNAISPEVSQTMVTVLDEVEDDPALRAVVLTGRGEVFSAGADLKVVAAGRANDIARGKGGFAGIVNRDFPKPIIAAVNGPALAGGFEIVLSCDLVVAAETATFGTPEINVGVWPMVISAILARNLPRKVVLEMLLLGDRWSAAQMKEAGLVNRVVAAERLDETTRELAGKLARKSPAVLRLGRDAFYRAEDMSLAEAMDFLQSQLTLVTLTEDTKEGVRAFFEKREPEFKGR